MTVLSTLAFRLPRSHLDRMLGTITAYPLTAEFQDAWDALPFDMYRGKPTRPSYSWLTTALCATTGQFVRLFAESDLTDSERAAGERMLLVTSRPFNHSFRIAVDTWERHHRRGRGQPELAHLLPEPDPHRLVREAITYHAGEAPSAPNWVFRIAAWQIMQHLAGTVLRIDGHRPMPLRLDTDGSLLTWDERDLIRNNDDTAHAMARVDLRLATMRGIDDLIVCFDGHLTRIANRWPGTRNLWIARTGTETPMLRLPVKHRPHHDKETDTTTYSHHLNQAVPKIVETCDLDPLPSLPEQLPSTPGPIRPQIAKNRHHPLGYGLGARFMLRLHEHVRENLPELEPLGYTIDDQVKLIKPIRKHTPGGLPASAINSTGHRRTVILCLYATVEARTRMTTELQALAGRPFALTADDHRTPINERLDLLAHHCPELLAHGHVNRAALCARLPVTTTDDELVAAWIETEYHPQLEIIHDAKPHLRRLLGRLTIPVQFLATEPVNLPDDAQPATPKRKREATRASLRGLLLNAGIIDHRVARATTDPRLRQQLNCPALLVGIHARRQQTGTGDEDPPLILTMVALRATPDPAASWPVSMYSEYRNSWQPIGPALANFHANTLGDRLLGRYADKAARTREHVEHALAELSSDQDNTNLPVVIFVDAQATRTIWPGLQNSSTPNAELPGDSLRATGTDVAVIRCNDDVTEIGRPVTRLDRANLPADPQQPAAPGRKIYKLEEGKYPVWLLAGVSRTYSAKWGDTGAKFTRWTLPEDLEWQKRRNWHAYTAIQIAIINAGTWEPTTLTALSARLCDQSASWDGRTLYPEPLHYAAHADEDHPDYRSEEAKNNTEEPVAAEDQDEDDIADSSLGADENL